MSQRDSDQDDQNASSAQREYGRGALFEGSRCAAYVILELLGAGESARVYRAEHEALRRDVALKVLKPGVLSGSGAFARFFQEARIATALQHPHFVQIFDVGMHEKLPYLAMELLDGEGLDARLRVQGTLAEPALIEIALPVMSALMAVHAAGAVHRDLKPGNIFLSRTPDGASIPKLLDFGIAKSTLSSASGGRMLRLGASPYMAPEVLLGGDVTAASDQYSLGVLLYECVTGVNPFSASTSNESTRRITTGKRRRVLDQVIKPSRGLADIIERALEVDPARRFPDVLSMARELLRGAPPPTRVMWQLKFAHPAPARQPDFQRSSQPADSTARHPTLTLLAIVGWLAASALAARELTSHADAGEESWVVQGPASESDSPRSVRHALQPRDPAPRSRQGSAQLEPQASDPASASDPAVPAATVVPALPLQPQQLARGESRAPLALLPVDAPHATNLDAPHATDLDAPHATDLDSPQAMDLGAPQATDAGATAAAMETVPRRGPIRGTNNAPIFE